MAKSMMIVLLLALAVNAQGREISEAKANDNRAMSDVQQTSNPYLLDDRREENERVCRDTSNRCSKLDGKCLDRKSECDGEFIDNACDGFSCKCCTPLSKPKCEDRTSKQCSSASGVCQNKNKKCSGDIIKGACKDKSCHCCVKKTPAPWRDDSKCGPHHLAPNGHPAQCDPNGDFPCCSEWGWCGISDLHCECPDCVDHRD